MRARLITIAAGALALAAMPAVAPAAPAKKAAAAKNAAAKPAAAPTSAVPPAGNTPEEHAMLYLKVLISGLQSDQVPEPIKGALVSCLYSNSLGKITESLDKAIAENPGNIRRDNPSEMLSAMAQICGYQHQGAAGAAAQGAPAAPGTAAPNDAAQPKGVPQGR